MNLYKMKYVAGNDTDSENILDLFLSFLHGKRKPVVTEWDIKKKTLDETMKKLLNNFIILSTFIEMEKELEKLIKGEWLDSNSRNRMAYLVAVTHHDSSLNPSITIIKSTCHPEIIDYIVYSCVSEKFTVIVDNINKSFYVYADKNIEKESVHLNGCSGVFRMVKEPMPSEKIPKI